MSTTRASLASSVRLLCGELPDCPISEGGLPSNLIFEELSNIEAELLRDLDLSIQNRRVRMEEIPLSSLDSFTVGASNFQAPTAAYLMTPTASDFWYPVELTTTEALPEATAAGRLAIAFSAGTGYFSWLPEGGQTLRLWYERSDSNTPLLATGTELASLYDEYLKIQCAAQCRQYLKLDLGSVLTARLERGEKQWQRFVNRSNQRGSAQKQPVFTPARRRYLGVDRTRFFVP